VRLAGGQITVDYVETLCKAKERGVRTGTGHGKHTGEIFPGEYIPCNVPAEKLRLFRLAEFAHGPSKTDGVRLRQTKVVLPSGPGARILPVCFHRVTALGAWHPGRAAGNRGKAYVRAMDFHIAFGNLDAHSNSVRKGFSGMISITFFTLGAREIFTGAITQGH
jgi:hypothetical protein